MSAEEVIAQEVWQAHVVEVGRSLPEGLADKMAATVVPALKAAGYLRESRIITTVDELDALPPESIVKTEGGTVACRFYDGVHGVVFGDERPFKWPTAMATELPALLLWHPDWNAS